MKNTKVTIISLIKDNFDSFKKTAYSIINQEIDFEIEWLILDGSNSKLAQENLKLLGGLKNICTRKIKIIHNQMIKKNIYDIYPSMNYGLKIATGSSLIFLNCGDIFFSKTSLSTMYKKLKSLKEENSFVFGQANIFYTKNLHWLYPSQNLKNIKKWLKYFDPNHQSMLITKKLAKSYTFDENIMVISDGIWKRNIIQNAKSYFYIDKPVVTFNLDGISNKRPKFHILVNQIKNKKVSFPRKIIVIIKFIIPTYFYFFYPILQKYKSLLIDQIF